MKDLFDPLRRLLLDICAPVKSQEDIAYIKQRLLSLKPEVLLKIASIEFLSPLVYYELRSLNIPQYERIMPKLKDSYIRNTARNLLLLKQVKLLKKQTKKQGINIILLKGAGLAITVYNEIGLRPMTDIDILVENQHIEHIKSLIEQNNLHPLFNDVNQNWLYSIKSHIMPYQSEDNILSLEVHTRLFDDRFIRFNQMDPFKKTYTAKWDNESFFILEPYTAFVYMLYHMVIHHSFSFRLRDVVDLRYMASYFKLDMREILSYIGTTQAAGLFSPLIKIAFEPVNSSSLLANPSNAHIYLYWANSVVMKYLPIQLTSRLSDATLRITTVLTSGIRHWLPGIFRFTDYEVSIFYKSKKPHSIFKKIGMALWVIIIAIVYVVCYPIFKVYSFRLKRMFGKTK